MGKTRHRSPAYPIVDLERAIEAAKQVYDADRRNLVPVSVALEHIGYAEGNSQGLRVIAALKQFGLMEDEGKKEDRQVRLTSRALDILIASSPSDPTRLRAIKEAALEPAIHAELWEHYDGTLPSDGTLRAYLIRHRSFNDTYVDRFIREFQATIVFAGLTESDTIPDDDSEESDEEDSDDDDSEPNRTPNHQRKKSRLERRGNMADGVQEDVFSLEDGQALVVQWPERMADEFSEDVQDWLKIIGRKIQRSFVSPNDCEDDDRGAAGGE